MFGNSKPVVFDPYGRRRSRRLIPRWMLLMLGGAAIGIGGVLYVQERYLPPRLSADASAKLQAAYAQADAERSRLAGQIAGSAKQLEAALADRQQALAELGAGRKTVTALRADIAALVASLPPDPRNGPVAVRAARFAVENGALVYDVVLSRDRVGAGPLGGVLEFIVAGASDRGAPGTVTLKPVPISVDGYDSVRGSLPLPPGFKPRQTTIHVLDKAGGKLLGMRVLPVK